MSPELDSESWDAWRPEAAARRLAGIRAPWYVAAGWSIDLFLGEQRREHEDLEIAIPACALDEVAAALGGLDLYAVNVPGKDVFTPLADAGEGLAETHQTWGRDAAADCWRIDVFREPGDLETWVCRRDERIRLPYAEVIAWTEEGIPYGRPEVTLLYKAKHAREKDEGDFQAALPRLDSAARARLREWLELVHPGHRWVDSLG